MIDYKTLTIQTQNGDMTSAYALYLATLKPIFYTVLKQTGNDSRAHLLVRDAYISAIKNINYLNHPESFPVWAQMIATKNTAAYLSKRKNFSVGKTQVPLNTEWNQAECDALDISESYAKNLWEEILKGINGEEQEAALLEDSENTKPKINEEKLNEVLVDLSRKKGSIRKRNTIIASVIVLALIGGLAGFTISSHKRTTTRHNIADLSDLYQNVSNAMVAKFASSLSGQLDGQIGEIYQLSDNTYYLLIYINNEPSGSMLVEYEENKQGGPDSLHVIAKKDEPITQVETETLKKDQYLNVNYNSNGNAIEKAISEASSADVDANNNVASIDEKIINDIISNSEAEKNKLQNIFGINSDTEDLNIVLTIKCRNVDLTKPVTITLDSSIASMIGNSGELKILLNDDRHWIKLSREQINKLCNEYNSVEVIVRAENNRIYNINFKGPDNEEIEQLYGDINFGIPCEHENSYVYATYSGGGKTYSEGGENRRGNFDASAKTISFPVSHAGKYELIGKETELFDIANLSKEVRDAIEFVASTEYIPAETNGYFKPNEPITRGLLMEALGKMFLTTNKNYKVYFGDVNPDDPDYDYIAAAWNNEIIYGYNGKFKADAIASNEEVLALCAKTLVACDYCNFIEDSEEAKSKITYTDKDSISKFAVVPVATAVEQKIVDGKGMLSPKNNATRAFAALVLYRMYMLSI